MATAELSRKSRTTPSTTQTLISCNEILFCFIVESLFDVSQLTCTALIIWKEEAMFTSNSFEFVDGNKNIYCSRTFLMETIYYSS